MLSEGFDFRTALGACRHLSLAKRTTRTTKKRGKAAKRPSASLTQVIAGLAAVARMKSALGGCLCNAEGSWRFEITHAMGRRSITALRRNYSTKINKHNPQKYVYFA
ncbi:hypothetical protein CDAR_294991 [Caerostris darwini]|uniref:Uncharacterized protein n=1 Tax=Caerostris darwini TaxID=1538125 RepID=A0AAV4UKF9_9ARAC|nr:hypothetical protein CDAR_294991 [Caerostris darwini]